MKKICSILAIIGTAIINSACMGPPNVPPIQEIKPNETAFVIPLEGDGTAQAQVQSVEYLKKKMVQAKRITIPIRQRDTGRFPGDFEWIPTVRVITVDRSLVTRQWSGMPVAGNAHPGIHVESKESINFRVGFNVTALVQEEDAATYLYWHAGKQLSEIIDSNIRGFVQDISAREFGALPLEECKADKNRIFAQVEKEAKEHFKAYGITIISIGNAGGLEYEDPTIQANINKTQNAQMDVQVAVQEKLAQVERNLKAVAKATADRLSAEEFAKAKEAQMAKLELDIKMTNAQAVLIAATRWDGKAPSMVTQGSGFLFGLDDTAVVKK